MINKAILVGRLTKDPEVRKNNENSVCSYTLAVRRRKTKNSNVPEADFINCVAWNQVADLMAGYLHKGSQIGVEGRIQTRNYEDQSGRKVYVTEVYTENITFLDSKKEEEQQSSEQYKIEDNELPF